MIFSHNSFDKNKINPTMKLFTPKLNISSLSVFSFGFLNVKIQFFFVKFLLL